MKKIILALIIAVMMLPLVGCEEGVWGDVDFSPKPIELVEFESYAALRVWLDEVYPEIQEATQDDWRCVDFAWWMFYRVVDDGYLLSFYVVTPEQYQSAFTILLETSHAMNATYIKGSTYLIEPQLAETFPDFEVDRGGNNE